MIVSLPRDPLGNSGLKWLLKNDRNIIFGLIDIHFGWLYAASLPIRNAKVSIIKHAFKDYLNSVDS